MVRSRTILRLSKSLETFAAVGRRVADLVIAAAAPGQRQPVQRAPALQRLVQLTPAAEQPEQQTREGAGLSVAEAARLAGMELSEWVAIEQGHVPEDLNRLHAMDDAMGVRYQRIATMALLCREAREL